jgi:Ca2+-binding RTX toxin-like protein
LTRGSDDPTDIQVEVGKLRKLIVLSLATLIGLAVVGVAAAERFRGTNGDDTIIGTFGDDVISSLAGNDTIDAEGGNDRVYAGAGNDRVIAGGGDDRVRGGEGSDDLSGGGGNDVLRGRPGNDSLNGGDGNDRMWPGSGEDTQFGGDGNDVLHALANDNQRDVLDCGAGRDVAVINAREPHDLAAANCERVRKVTPTPQQAATDDNG